MLFTLEIIIGTILEKIVPDLWSINNGSHNVHYLYVS